MVDNLKAIRSERGSRLIKAEIRTTDANYSEARSGKDSYPELPPANSKWDGPAEVYVFCSNNLPTYIQYDQQKKKYVGTIPFDQDGVPSGATEGIANLYSAICNNGKEPKFEINPDLLDTELVFRSPADIFSLLN